MAEKTESKTINQAKEKASIALMDAITDSVADIRASGYKLTAHTSHLRDLAYAYRLVSGGAQPGNVEISTK
ncbi:MULTISPECIES: hypothetical protein [Bacteria]|uniref:hypothetical protein n=1 Tax=Bacteria TaxID=2 RepID=UPI003C79BC0B